MDPVGDAGDAPLRLLFCTLDYFPSLAGGAEHQAMLQAEALTRRGHSVTVVCASTGLPRRQVIRGVSVRRLPVIDRRYFRRASHLLGLALFLVLRARQFDVVHVHLANLQADVAVAAGGLVRRPVYVKCAAGGAVGEVARARRLVGRLTRYYGLRMADCVQALSLEIEEELMSIGVSSENVARIPNGVNLERFHPCGGEAKTAARGALGLPGGGLIYLFVGRFATYKGLGDLLLAWSEMHLDGATLVLVGAEAEDSPFGPIPPLPGLLVRGWSADIDDYLSAADVFVHPTHGDGMSNALLEAMAAGKAIVATRLGSTNGLLTDYENALLVDAGSPASLAKALCTVADNPAMAASIGARAARSAQAFEINEVVVQIESVYRRLVARRSFASGRRN